MNLAKYVLYPPFVFIEIVYAHIINVKGKCYSGNLTNITIGFLLNIDKKLNLVVINIYHFIEYDTLIFLFINVYKYSKGNICYLCAILYDA